MMDDLISDGEIHESTGFWYALYEFELPLSDDRVIVAKRALLYRFMEFLENSTSNEFYHKIIVHKDFRQVPDFLGRNFLHKPSIGLIIEKTEKGE